MILFDILIIDFHILLQKYYENYGFKGFKWNQAKICVIFLFFWVFLEKFILLGDSLGDSENDSKINVFLAAVETAVDVNVDADVRFKDLDLVIIH